MGAQSVRLPSERASPQATGVSIPQLTSFGEDGVGRPHATAGRTRLPIDRGAGPRDQSIGTFDAPSAIAALRGDPNLLYSSLARSGSRANGQVVDFIDLDVVVQTGGEQGLLAVALLPDYTTSGRVFVYYTANGGDLTLDEVRCSPGDSNRADPAASQRPARSSTPERRITTAVSCSSGRMDISTSTGDGGGQGSRGRRPEPRPLLGKILRLDVNVGAAAPPPGATPIRDAAAPKLRVRVKRRQRLLRLRGAVARVRCNEACAVRAGVLDRQAPLPATERPCTGGPGPPGGCGSRFASKPRRHSALRRCVSGRRPVVRVGLRATDSRQQVTNRLSQSARAARAAARRGGHAEGRPRELQPDARLGHTRDPVHR